MSSTAPVRRAPAPATTAQHALEELRHAIVSGSLTPGQRLVQEEIAEWLGISIAPVREALKTLEQEGQLRYQPRRGYFVIELDPRDLVEIYALRQVLEERAVRAAVPALDDGALQEVQAAARAGAEAALSGDVAAELVANRRFHFGLMTPAGQVHTLRLIRLLWDSTEVYRAIYYNAPAERRAAVQAHDRIIAAARKGDADAVVAELDAHRDRALRVLCAMLGGG